MPSPKRSLNVLLVSYNTQHLLRQCLDALKRSLASYPDARIIVVDNASRDDSVAFLREHYPEVELIESGSNLGFGRANNLALPHLDGEALLLLNTDAFVEPDSIKLTMQHLAAHPDVGVIGVRLVGRDGALQPSCRYFPTPLNMFLNHTGLARWFPWVKPVDDMAWDHASARDCDWVPGCYYLIRGEVLERVGLFDPRFFLYMEEVDHCRRVKAAGWRVRYVPDTAVVHIGGESARSDNEITNTGRQVQALHVESMLLYFRKHRGVQGPLALLALEVVAAVLVSLKAALKGRGWLGISAPWRGLAVMWSLLGRTRWGQQPVH
jgi:N-acetylglucosaminyl-diphospho-decaprenol L-rhamnosyltransferase